MRREWIFKGEMWSRWMVAGLGGLLAVTLLGTIPAQAAVIRSGTVYCSAGQQLIISSDTVGQTYHRVTNSSGSTRTYNHGFRDYPYPSNTRAATWTGLRVAAGEIEAPHILTSPPGHQRFYCAG